MQWPAGFMWGTGASSTQCEGAAPASDWLEWEREGHAPPSRDGNGFGTRHREDFALYASLGLTHHRLSIEWARIEPEEGRRDHAAIAHYRDVLHAAAEAGVQPWVCLHHFTLPRWFAGDGGFLVESNRTYAWAQHVDFVAETFGDLVAGWQPVNETNYYASAAYRGGGWPPGHNDRDEWAFAMEVIQRRIYEVNWDTGIGLFRDGVLRVPGREPIERPDLAGSFDLIGFSYYAAIGVRDGAMAIHPPDAPTSPLGYGIWADGLGRVLDRLHAELPGTPLLIAEYGIGTDDDEVRATYLRRGLEITAAALKRGIDVRGFFHWTGVDNYEWLHGYDVSFGIIDRDRNVRASALVLSAAARS